MHSHIIFFDGVCNLCNGAVQFVLKNDKHNVFKFASLQSNFAQKLLIERNLPSHDFDTIILLENGRIYTKSNAIFRIARKLPNFYWLSYFSILPQAFTDFCYDIISKNRLKWFGKRESCWLPNKELNERFL
jgi:predicted DCC family thiol-disulfide oxidoreductase YuxK